MASQPGFVHSSDRHVTTLQTENTVAGLMASAGDASQQQFQRLKVEDALSYLDKVKLQFGNHPQVYNDFLDIMKEFKSQSIDTPGVIARVSNLFKGHPDLIVGFNTFLPPGFKIEVTNTPGGHTIIHSSTSPSVNVSITQPPMVATAHSAVPKPSVQSQQQQLVAFLGPQPVEFNQAVNYVNKIRSRFQNAPDIYKAFLEILHTYQKEQRVIKEGGTPGPNFLTENEVYTRVSELFKDEDDLLAEFGQFLPDCTAHFSGQPSKNIYPTSGQQRRHSSVNSSQNGKSFKAGQLRKGNHSNSTPVPPPSKRQKTSTKDILAEAGKLSYVEQAMFDKIRKSLKSPDAYDNFLRCLMLFNEEIVTREELIILVGGSLRKQPDLYQQFKQFLGHKDSTSPEPLTPSHTPTPTSIQPKERVNELINELDFNNLKRYGASYRALPKSCQQAKCSGRTDLCREVLNDVWVSFPTWSEGDSQFSSSRKTQYEEQMFRCEDERFELDLVLEMNISTIRVFESLQRKMEQMSSAEVANFKLDKSLGGTSKVIHRKAIHRIYGDKAGDILEGLEKNPSVALPIVLKRLKSKQEEWLEAQRGFNKVWREQLEKYHLKSLDHQGITFKATDSRAIRSKSLISEIETICDERQDQNGETTGPHMNFYFALDSKVFADVIGLLLFYLYNNTTLQREDRMKVKDFLCHFLHEFFFFTGQDLGGEEDLLGDSDSEGMDVDTVEGPTKKVEVVHCMTEEQTKTSTASLDCDQHVLYCNNTWYIFFRLIQILCSRLEKLYQQSQVLIERDPTSKELQNQAASVLLGLKKPVEIETTEYYPVFIKLVKSLLDGNTDNNSFEDLVREMFGVHAYVSFTMDKVIQGIMRQIQPMVLDATCQKLSLLYLECLEQKSKQDDSDCSALDTSYQRKVEAFLGDENLYRIVMDKQASRLSIELLDVQQNAQEEVPETKKWKEYVAKFSKPVMNLSDLQMMPAHRKIFLSRHTKLKMEKGGNSSRSDEEDELPHAVTRKSHASLINQAFFNLVIHGGIEFKMDKNSYRMVPLANSEDYMYRIGSLQKAKEVGSRLAARLHSRFDSWYQKWVLNNVTEDQMVGCDHWFQASNGSNVTSRKTSEEFLGITRHKYITGTKSSFED